MKSLFDLLVMPISIFDNVLLDFVVLGLVGVIAYRLAYFIIGETDLREIFKSIGHWTIRFFIYCTICYFIKIALLYIILLFLCL